MKSIDDMIGDLSNAALRRLLASAWIGYSGFANRAALAAQVADAYTHRTIPPEAIISEWTAQQ
jgi:hypothetical protein